MTREPIKTCRCCGVDFRKKEYVAIECVGNKYIKAWNSSMPQWRKFTGVCIDCFNTMMKGVELIDVWNRGEQEADDG